MALAACSDIEVHACIDDLLGDGSYRFFSQGYKSTNPQLHDLRVTHTASESTLSAHASLAMKGLWSVKGQSEQTPHLGTTDVLVLACKMAEALLASRYSPEILIGAYLKSVSISGGSEPVEGTLDRLDCLARVQGAANGSSSVLSCSVASMTATIEVIHSSFEQELLAVRSSSEEDLVGAAGTRLYGDLWADRHVSLKDVRLSAQEGTVHAQLSFRHQTPWSQGIDRRGLEAAYPHGLSAIEYFVATLQLGQVLLYRFDSLARADSNTLWMRKTRMALSRPTHRRAGEPGIGLGVHLRNNRVIEKDGGSWRCADVVGTFDDGEVVCSVTHRLPARRDLQAQGVER
ncbi:AvrD family protein [Microbacterium sp. NPDC076768]|uniref:AvrD family protein n=1 Tax=Microbacterium sp. NPDC076768 TaxID=3154858 RepID=UPI003446E8EB